MFASMRVFASNLSQVLTSVIQYGCISHCFLEYIADLSICSGPSMEPTLSDHDIIMSEHISTKMHRFNYGDIVISKSPVNPRDYVCKRITGLPGDQIQYKDFNAIPSGHVWLEGDNRDNSYDSNDYGPVPQGLIQGRVICKIWPLHDMAMLTVRSH